MRDSNYVSFRHAMMALAVAPTEIPTLQDAAGFYNDIGAEMLSTESPGKISFVHAAPGFIKTSWGTEMPTVIRWMVRGLQHLGRSKEDCGEYMFKAIYGDECKGGGFFLLDEFGERTAKLTKLHDEAKTTVWEHTKKVVTNLGSAA